MKTYWNERKHLHHTKRVQLPQDKFEMPTWLPFLGHQIGGHDVMKRVYTLPIFPPTYSEVSNSCFTFYNKLLALKLFSLLFLVFMLLPCWLLNTDKPLKGVTNKLMMTALWEVSTRTGLFYKYTGRIMFKTTWTIRLLNIRFQCTKIHYSATLRIKREREREMCALLEDSLKWGLLHVWHLAKKVLHFGVPIVNLG